MSRLGEIKKAVGQRLTRKVLLAVLAGLVVFLIADSLQQMVFPIVSLLLSAVAIGIAAFLIKDLTIWERLPEWGKRLVLIAVLIGFTFLPFTVPQYLQAVLFSPVGIFVLLALGLNVVVGMAGLLDLGYVAFYAVGAYTTAMLTTSSGLDAWAALPLAVGAAMIAGVILGAPTLRLRGDYLAIVTLGFGEIVRLSAVNSETLGSTRGVGGIPNPAPVGGIEFGLEPLPYYFLALTAIVLTLVFIMHLTKSRIGRAWIALREDEDAAEAMGVHTYGMKLWAFAIGASTGGLAGWLYASKVGYINPENFPLFFSITILAAVVLGGMGSLPGVILGAFALAFLPEYLRDNPAGETIAGGLNAIIGGPEAEFTEFRVLIFGAAIVAMMVFRPQGLWPSRRRALELKHGSEVNSLSATTTEQEAVDADIDAQLGAEGLIPEARPITDIPATVIPTERPDRALSIENVLVRFGGVTAVNDVSFTVKKGEIFGVIGPNGAGKTTLFNTITGIVKPTSGQVKVGSEKVSGKKVHQITESGIARTFQNIRLFPDMTALENVMVAGDSRQRRSTLSTMLGLPGSRKDERMVRAEAESLLSFVGVAERGGDLARNLSYGDQRRLEIARALACGPSVLLLDEPAAGMNPSEKVQLTRLIRDVRDSGFTVVLIEHDMGLVMGLCDRIAVLDFGEKIAEGVPSDVRNNERVVQAYLGVDDDAVEA